MAKVIVKDSRFLSGITEIPSFKIGDLEFVFEADLSEKGRRVAEKELRETPERVKESLEELKRLLSQEEDLTWPNNDFFLIKYLRKCKFYPESAFQLLKKYFEIKVKNPEYFYDVDINYYIEIANLRIVDMMPRRDHKGRRIFVVRNLGKFDPNLYTMEQLFKGVAMMMEAVSLEPDTQVNGVVIVLDLKELALYHLKPLTPSFIRFGMKWCQDCIPLRLKGLHVINETSMIDATYVIIKNFLSEKLRNRIYFHGKDYEMIHEYIAPNCLPTEYGGTISLGDCPKVEELMEMYGDFIERCKKEMDVINSYGYKKDLTENTQL